MDHIHEFMMLRFAEEIEPGPQMLVIEALEAHLWRCSGVVDQEYIRAEDGDWVQHVIWRSEAELEDSARLEEDPVVAALFGYIDERSVSYLRGRRVDVAAP